MNIQKEFWKKSNDVINTQKLQLIWAEMVCKYEFQLLTSTNQDHSKKYLCDMPTIYTWEIFDYSYFQVKPSGETINIF